MKQNALKVKTKLELMKQETLDIFNKFLTAEDILDQPETAYAVGKAFEMYDEAKELYVDQAEQLDDMAEMLKDSYHEIEKLNRKIDMLHEIIVELRKEVKEAQ